MSDPSGLLTLSGGSWRFSEKLPGEPLDDWPLRVVEDAAAGRYIIAARALKAGECVCCSGDHLTCG